MACAAASRIGRFGDRPADHQMGGAEIDRLARRHHPLLVVGRRCRPDGCPAPSARSPGRRPCAAPRSRAASRSRRRGRSRGPARPAARTCSDGSAATPVASRSDLSSEVSTVTPSSFGRATSSRFASVAALSTAAFIIAAAAGGVDGDEGRLELDHGADAARHRVGNVVQLEVEEEADAGRPHRRREGVAHAGRAVGQEELEAQLDAADRRPRAAGDRLDQPGGVREIDRVDGAIDGIGTAGHGGAQPRANVPAIQSGESPTSPKGCGTAWMPMASASEASESQNPADTGPALQTLWAPDSRRAFGEEFCGPRRASCAPHCAKSRQTPIKGNGLCESSGKRTRIGRSIAHSASAQRSFIHSSEAVRTPHPEEAAKRPSRRMATDKVLVPTLRDAALRAAPQGEVIQFDLTQWIAAYMIFSSVASRAENSSTTLPCAADQDAVGQRHDLGQVGRDHDHRLALVGQPVDQLRGSRRSRRRRRRASARRR